MFMWQGLNQYPVVAHVYSVNGLGSIYNSINYDHVKRAFDNFNITTFKKKKKSLERDLE